MSSTFTPKQIEKLTELRISKLNTLFASKGSNIQLQVGDDFLAVLTLDFKKRYEQALVNGLEKGILSPEVVEKQTQEILSEHGLTTLYKSMFIYMLEYASSQLDSEQGELFNKKIDDDAENELKHFVQIYTEFFSKDKNDTLIKGAVLGYKTICKTYGIPTDPITSILS